MSKPGIWSIDQTTIVTFDNVKNVENLLIFMLREFSRIFSDETMYYQPCNIINDPNANCPKFYRHNGGQTIRLHVNEKLNFLNRAQIVYQLSHELCHYTMSQHKANKDYYLYWFEEIICDAMSLYMLRYAKNNWRYCKLYKIDPKYMFSFGTYLAERLNEKGTDRLDRIKTIEEFKAFDDECQENRENHRKQRNELYEFLKGNNASVGFLQYYSNYIIAPDDLLIDFARWKLDHPELTNNAAFNALERFQPQIQFDYH